MRIVSLIPSATEILFALGLGETVYGVTHECDFPPEAKTRPVVTRCVFDSAALSPAEIDSEVRRLAREEKSLYEIDEKLLSKISPDLIITQELCDVCAVTPDEVDRAHSALAVRPRL